MKGPQQARYLQDKETQIIKNCWGTTEGKKFIELLRERFGDPRIHDSELKTFVALGEFQVIRFINQTLLEGIEDV